MSAHAAGLPAPPRPYLCQLVLVSVPSMDPLGWEEIEGVVTRLLEDGSVNVVNVARQLRDGDFVRIPIAYGQQLAPRGQFGYRPLPAYPS